MSDTDSITAAAETPAPEPKLRYRVLVESVKVGTVTAYRGAIVNIEASRVDAAHKIQPGTFEFAGV